MRILLGFLLFLIGIKVLSAQEATKPEEFLSKLITYKTVNNFTEEKRLAGFLSNFCKNNGLYVKDLSNSDTSTLLLISLFPPAIEKQTIVLLSHLDVVGTDSTGWKKPPFEGVIENDTVWGRGAIDLKGIATMQLFSILKLKSEIKQNHQLPYNIMMLIVGNEELGGKNGAEVVCNRFFHELNPAVVLGEGGAGLTTVIPGKPDQKVFFVSVAEKRNLWLKLETKTRTHGHASIPSDKSANKILLRAIHKIENEKPKIVLDKTSKRMFKQLGEITGGTKGFIIKHINWWIFKPFRRKILAQNELLLPMVTNTFTLTKIYNPPGAINQITQESAAYYDCRLMPRFNETAFTMRRLTRIIDPRIKITVVAETPEAPPTKPDYFFKVLEQSVKSNFPGAEVVPYMFIASSDNSYFRACGIPTYGLMPLEMSRELLESVHAVNEAMPIKALYKGIEVYTQFLKTATTQAKPEPKKRLINRGR